MAAVSAFCIWTCLFMIYSFLGWACESIYCSFALHRLSNRGFLNGPLCPIYAAGAFGTLWLAGLIPHNVILVFLLGLAVDTLIEYGTGTLLELAFHTKYWDYSEERFNFRGRICLKNALLFGLMSAALVLFIHPFFYGLVASLPAVARDWTAAVLLCLFGADLAVSVATALKLNIRLRLIQEGMQTVKEKLDSFGFESSATIRERLDRLAETSGSEPAATAARAVDAILERVRNLEQSNQLQRRLLRAFPKIRSTRYPEYLSRIMAQFDSRRHRG